MNSIAVYCASGNGVNPVYKKEAYEFGAFLARNNKRIVFGGSQLGLMGAVADGALENGGEVIGVLPNFMSHREIAHHHLTELIMVESMHERKLKMHELSDAVVALPGGFGTLEELFEMLTWAQLDIHTKPIALLNINDYFEHLIKMIEHMLKEGLLKTEYESLLAVESDQSILLRKLESLWKGKDDKSIAQKRS